jgi:hypothetical protein
MDTDTNHLAGEQRAFEDDALVRTFRPRSLVLSRERKGTAARLVLNIVPACGDRDGAVYLTLAQQRTVAAGSTGAGNRHMPRSIGNAASPVK